MPLCSSIISPWVISRSYALFVLWKQQVQQSNNLKPMASTDKEGKQMILITIKIFDDDHDIGIALTGLGTAMDLVKAQVTKIILA